MQVAWNTFKNFVDSRSLSVQWVVLDDGITYWLKALDGYFSLECMVPANQPEDAAQIDFEANYKAQGNQSPTSVVTTQFELNNKDLKLARCKVAIVEGAGTVYLPVPGTFGAPGQGRYVAGGYALVDSYDADDFVCVYVEDKDRHLAAAYGTAAELERSMTDEEMQGQGDFPAYPVVKSYTDDELPEEHRGWHFWPLVVGNNLAPYGETEIDPIGGYGFIPAGFYVKIVVTRPNVSNGTSQFDIFWGKKE